MMFAGSLDHRITLQRRSTWTDLEYEETREGFETLKTVSASVRHASGREFLSAGAIVNERRAIFTIRWREGLTTLDRLVYAGAPFNIKEIREIGRREGLEIFAEAVA